MTTPTRQLILLAFILAFHSSHIPVAFGQGSCSGRQSYIFTVTTSFTPNVDTTIPSDGRAAIPVMVAVAHKASAPLFKIGQVLQDHVAEVVSSSTTQKFLPVIRELRDNKTISSWEIIAEGRDETVGVQDEVKFDLELRDDASHVSILAPLSPSPDWFIGWTGDLCKHGTFRPEMNNLKFEILDGGLKKGEDWNVNVDPVGTNLTKPVSPVQDKKEIILAIASYEKGSLGTNWWRILLIVLAVVSVLAFGTWFFFTKFKKRRRPSDLPLTTNEGVEW